MSTKYVVREYSCTDYLIDADSELEAVEIVESGEIEPYAYYPQMTVNVIATEYWEGHELVQESIEPSINQLVMILHATGLDFEIAESIENVQYVKFSIKRGE